MFVLQALILKPQNDLSPPHSLRYPVWGRNSGDVHYGEKCWLPKRLWDPQHYSSHSSSTPGIQGTEAFTVGYWIPIGWAYSCNLYLETTLPLSPSQDRDFCLLHHNDPLFLTFSGETLRYKGTEPLYPFFVNECAYYEKGIALSLARLRSVEIPSIRLEREWEQEIGGWEKKYSEKIDEEGFYWSTSEKTVTHRMNNRKLRLF